MATYVMDTCMNGCENIISIRCGVCRKLADEVELYSVPNYAGVKGIVRCHGCETEFTVSQVTLIDRHPSDLVIIDVFPPLAMETE